MVLDNPTPDTNESVNATDFKMTEGEYAELRAAADVVYGQDVQVGYAFRLFALHLGHLNGFDPVQEDAKIKQAQEDKAKAEEDAAATPETPPTDVPIVSQNEVSA